MRFTGGTTLCLPVSDSSEIGETRRRASFLAKQAGFDEEKTGAVAIAATEIATNLVRHGGGGEILLRAAGEGGEVPELEILGIDQGSGMEDVGRCLRDGFSTGGTSGTGLGAVRRLSSVFDLHSVPGKGTIVLARFSDRDAEPPPGGALQVGAVSLPVKGELECGDAWGIMMEPGRAVLVVADGLGHGAGAARASAEALRVFRERASLPPAPMLQFMHDSMRSTRGAAVAVAEISPARSSLAYAGVGNISARIGLDTAGRSLISFNGILGHEMRKLQEFSYPWERDAILVMYSDGLGSRWSLDSYPGLVARDPAVIAATLYRDFRRERDDVTVVVVR